MEEEYIIMRIAFICDTPLQIFNCINIMYNFYKDENCEFELYFGHNFRNSEAIVQKIREQEIFEKVYEFDSMMYFSKKWKYRVECLLFPQKTLKKHLRSDVVESFYYDSIFISGWSHFTRQIFLNVNFKEVNMFEDGLGSYTGKVFYENDIIRKVLNTFKYHGKLNLRKCNIFLNNPDGYYDKRAKSIYKMPDFSEVNPALAVINNIFGYQSSSLYADKKIIYFTQPMGEIMGEKEKEGFALEQGILGELQNQYAEHFLLRVHPRMDNLKYCDYTVDKMNNMWELECMHSIDEEKILVTFDSTAVFSPAFLYGKKPYVVFLVDMDETKKIKALQREQLISDLKKIYGEDEKKVITPKNKKEFFKVLSELMNK